MPVFLQYPSIQFGFAMLCSVFNIFRCKYVLRNEFICHFRRLHTSRAYFWKVMFFGTDDFSVECLHRLCIEFEAKRNISRLEIVTSSYKKNPVRLYGEKKELNVHSWPVSRSVVEQFDVGLVASFGHLVSQEIISAFPLGMLNIHGSILPRWRGAAPVIHAVLHGDSESGITIMRLRPFKFDEGEIVSIRKTDICPTETSSSLRKRLACLGSEELIEVLQKLPDILQTAVPQPLHGVTYAPKVTSAHGLISFQNMRAIEVYNRYRALSDIVPVKTSWMGQSLRLQEVCLHDTSPLNNENHLCAKNSHSCITTESELERPGQVLYCKCCKTMLVWCMDREFVKVGKLATSKKRFLTSAEFYNGYLSNKPKSKWIFD